MRLVVVSIDGLSTADLPRLESLCSFHYLMENGALCREMRGIYPTQTYPLHTSLITGCHPLHHGVEANTLFQPGRLCPDWHWYRRHIRAEPLYDVLRRAGRDTASILWPGAARSANRYVIPELMTTGRGQSLAWLLITSGSALFMVRMALRYRSLLKSLAYSHVDDFTSAVTADLIRASKVDLLLLHLLDLDGTRHRRGFHAPETHKVLEEQDRRLGILLAAIEDSACAGDTAIIVFGDHAYFDVHTRIRINAALLEAGLIRLDSRGRLLDWKAWANSCEGSAQIRLRDPQDPAVHDALREVFARLQARPDAPVERVYARDQVREMGVAEDIDYVLEATPGFYFVHAFQGDILAPAEGRMRAVHGYHPDRSGYSSVFMAAGSGIRRGVELEAVRIVDLGPTLAALLGVALPAAEGRVLTEMLKLR